MFVLFQIASDQTTTLLGTTPSGWITNGIVVALVLFIRHMYEDRLKSEKERRDELKENVKNLDERDQVRADALDRTLRSMEQQGELSKSQNAMIVDMYEKNAVLMANMQGRLDASDRRERSSR